MMSSDISNSFVEICKKIPIELQEEYFKGFIALSQNPDLKLDNVKINQFYKHIHGSLLTKPFNIENTFKIKEERGNWDFFYVYVDIHGTILEPDYGGLAKKYYPLAKETLKKLSDRSDVCLVLYTCSHNDEIGQYLDFFEDDGILFDGINNSPVENTRGGNFTEKPYFNVLLEDKAGFNGELDWYIVDYIFSKYPDKG